MPLRSAPAQVHTGGGGTSWNVSTDPGPGVRPAAEWGARVSVDPGPGVRPARRLYPHPGDPADGPPRPSDLPHRRAAARTRELRKARAAQAVSLPARSSRSRHPHPHPAGGPLGHAPRCGVGDPPPPTRQPLKRPRRPPPPPGTGPRRVGEGRARAPPPGSRA